MSSKVQIVEERIQTLVNFGNLLTPENPELAEVIQRTTAHNGWFDHAQVWQMLNSFRNRFFQDALLREWVAPYQLTETPKQVGLVLAGNVPFVGMHDIVCVLMSGHHAQIKLSSKDAHFFPWMQEKLLQVSPAVGAQMQFVERLVSFDAVIATGSNNAARYFHQYFDKYPHIIRKNRTSVAILHGDESAEDIIGLGRDVFSFYGLGCRNVGKVFVPQDFDRQELFRHWASFEWVMDNTKYKHNYDYNRALLLLNKTPYLTNDFYMLVETEQLF